MSAFDFRGFVTFIRERGGQPSRLEASVRTLAENGIEAGEHFGIRIVANEDCPPGIVYVLPPEETR